MAPENFSEWHPRRGSQVRSGRSKRQFVDLDAAGNATQFTSTPNHEVLPCGPRMAPDRFLQQREGVYDIYVKPVTGEGRAEVFFKSTLPSTLPTGRGRPIHSVWRSGPKHPVGRVGDDYLGPEKPHPSWIRLTRKVTRRFRRTENGSRSNSDESGRTEVYVQPFEGAASAPGSAG